MAKLMFPGGGEDKGGEEVPETREKESANKKSDETSQEVGYVKIERLDDGSFLYTVCPKNMEPDMKMLQYSMKNLEDVHSSLEDDLGTPHMKKYPSDRKEKLRKSFGRRRIFK